MSDGPLDPAPDAFDDAVDRADSGPEAAPVDDRDALLDDDAPFGEDAAAVRTGHESVDAVLEEVARLDDRPLEEHVGAFERAHEQLRRALDAQPER